MLEVCVMLEAQAVHLDGVQTQVIVVLYQIQDLLINLVVVEETNRLHLNVQQEVTTEQMLVLKVVSMDILMVIEIGVVQKQEYLPPKPKSVA